MMTEVTQSGTAPWCSGQSFSPLEAETLVRIRAGLLLVRKFQKGDALQVSSLIHRSQRVTLSKCYSKRVTKEFCKINSPKDILRKAEDRQLFVAEEKKRILGVIGIKENELKTFFVDPKHQGRGVGRNLYERFKKEALKNGHKQVFLHATFYAVPIYQKFGFTRIRRIKREINGIPFYDVLMKMKYA